MNPTTKGLNPRHYQEIVEGSGVSPEIAGLNFWTAEDPRDLDGLLGRNLNRKWQHSNELVPAWVGSGVDPETGEPWGQGAQVKPDVSPLNKDGKPQKYLGATGEKTQPLFLDTGKTDFWPGVIADKTIPIYLTEGPKKGAALLTVGRAGISVPGVWTAQHKGILKPLLTLFCVPGRVVVLTFDADWRTNPQVFQALDRLGRLVAATGAVVKVAIWDEKYKGIDDLLVGAGQDAVTQALDQAITFEQWRDTYRTETESEPQQLVDYRKLTQFFDNQLRYNELTKTPELNGEPFEEADAKLNLAIDYGLKLKSSEEQVSRICVRIAKEHSFSPVRDYLESVYRQYGQDSQAQAVFEGLAKSVLGTDDPIHQMQLEKSLKASVARAYQPGAKVDSMPIIQGKQGEGKSTLLRTLAGPEWFDDSLDLDTLGDKDSRLQLHSAWIIEFQEAEQLFSTKRQRGTLKGFLTTRTDRLRRPYGRSFEALDRHFLIFGTTNHKQFLDDPTGNRRFWILPVKKQIPIEYVEASRDLIWAAAVAAYKRGEPWWLTPDEAALVAAKTQEYESQDPWHDAIAAFVEGVSTTSISRIFDQVLKLDLSHQTLHEQRRVASVLTALGWEKGGQADFDGKRQRVWKKC